MELHNAKEATGIRKILSHDIRMTKNPQTTLWIFKDFHELIQIQSPTRTFAQKFYQWWQ